MRKILIFNLFILCFFSSITAQIKVTSDGKIGLGTLSPSYPVHLKATTFQLNFLYSNSYDVVMHDNYQDPVIEPSTYEHGYLGYSYPWYQIKGRNIYYINLASYSDKNSKENIRNISGALSKIKQLQGIQYDFVPSYFNNIEDQKWRERLRNENKDQYGLIA